MARVIVLDPLAPEGVEVLRNAAGIEYEERLGLQGADLHAALLEFDGAICRSGVRLDAAALEGNRRLRAIARAGVGTDNIDLKAATRLGVVVMNTPTGNTISTAEHTLALMLALARNVAPAYQGLIEGRWDRKQYIGTQLADKTLGVIGLGRVGQAVARRAKAFNMRVIGFDPFVSSERTKELGVEAADSIEDLLPRIDFLTVHTPLTDETHNLINRERMALLRPGVRLINCARGGIYDEAALVEGLESGQIAGVALDVYAHEPCTDSPLFGMPGVVATPHLGASTEEAQSSVAIEGASILVDFLTRGAIRHAVNMIPLDPKQLADLRGFFDVAYRMGSLLAQLHRGVAKSCTLQYRGEVAEKETKLITASFCAGLLQGALAADINIVNAEILLRERGIELREQTSSDKGDFSSLITVELVTERDRYKAAGTLFGNKLPRLVRLGDYRLEAFLDGVLLVFTHNDVPGIIGTVGTIFGQHHTNIAQMAVGRAHEGGPAIGVLNLDSQPPPEALAEVLAHPDVHSVTVINLPAAGDLPAWMLT